MQPSRCLVGVLLLATAIAIREYLKTPSEAINNDEEGYSLVNHEDNNDHEYNNYEFEMVSGSSLISEQNFGEKILHVGKGDTLMSLLLNIGVPKEEAHLAIQALKKVFDPKDLKIGQTIYVKYYQESPKSPLVIQKFFVKLHLEYEIHLTSTANEKFQAKKQYVQLVKTVKRVDGVVNTSFYKAALNLNIPANIIKEAIQALSYNVNFQHGISQGDPFEILYEVYTDKSGRVVKTGSLKYVAFAPKDQLHQIYYYQPINDVARYYNVKGESVQRGLLQAPIDPTKMRITSKFGLRLHPIKGYTKQHKGVDFSAPQGTVVMAAGEGVIGKAGYNGNYGNYILITHNGGYQTAYAHLSKIHVRPGTKVKQMQPIGTVGATGLATGPHLHFEVIKGGTHVNPLTIKQLPTVQLNGKDLSHFNKLKKEVDLQVVGIVPKNHSITQQSLKTTG